MSAASSTLPKRVLQIGSSTSDPIKLVEPPPNTTARYIALSHCWSTHQPIKTTLLNLCLMRSNIPWTSLSAVFQDAIAVSRKLGMEYIWIDSLCIIQDSTPDWEIESSKMGSYYSGAYLTISASSSPNGTIPFLCPRGPDSLPKTFAFHTSDGEMVNITARKHTGSSMSQLVEPLSPLASRGWWCCRAPLSLRGWVMQERILPVRTLHFTKNQVFWECGETFASEAFPIQISPLFKFQAWTKDYVDNDIGWADLVKHYSRCNLTLTKDKLVAISGLAQFVHSKTNDQYLAGLWRESLCSHLCWFVTPRQIRTRISPYTAPTWSWASLHASVIFWDPYSSITMLPQLTNVEITHTSNDPFGQISYAKLHLSCGHFASAHVEDWNLLREGTGRITLPNGNSLQLDLHPDSELDLDRDRDVYLTSINGSRSRTSIVGLILNPLATWLGNTKGWDCLLFTSLVTK
ncbi:HET-domain-containing protein [Cadophora sp. DSE1049]|nr:HET-domain-containing protein [Cadophora sp. DSE1049]